MCIPTGRAISNGRDGSRNVDHNNSVRDGRCKPRLAWLIASRGLYRNRRDLSRLQQYCYVSVMAGLTAATHSSRTGHADSTKTRAPGAGIRRCRRRHRFRLVEWNSGAEKRLRRLAINFVQLLPAVTCSNNGPDIRTAVGVFGGRRVQRRQTDIPNIPRRPGRYRYRRLRLHRARRGVGA